MSGITQPAEGQEAKMDRTDRIQTPRIRSLALDAQRSLSLASEALENGDPRLAQTYLDLAKREVSLVEQAQNDAVLATASAA